MSDLTLAQWQHKAAHLTLPSQAFINGSYRDAVNGATFDCINPANGKLLTKVAACDAADAELAVPLSRTNAGAACRRNSASRSCSASPS